MTFETARSVELSERAQRVIPGGVSSSLRFLDPPRVFTRARGSRIWDADGREYIDFHAGFGPIILGHADDRVREVAMETAAEIDVIGAGSSELEIQLAEKIREHVPSAERVLFSNSGSEATYHAIRVARAATGRNLVVKFQGCYHGWHDYIAANVISQPDRVGSIDPISAGILPQALEWLVVLPFNDVEALDDLMRERGHEIAAVILEPVIHTIGCVVPTDEFMSALRRTTTEAGSILIFDEVVTGFRHDLGGYQAICGITPGPDHVRQGDRQRLSARGAVRPGRPDGALQHASRGDRHVRRHLQRPPAVDGRRAGHDRDPRGRRPRHPPAPLPPGQDRSRPSSRASSIDSAWWPRRPASARSSCATSPRARSARSTTR